LSMRITIRQRRRRSIWRRRPSPTSSTGSRSRDYRPSRRQRPLAWHHPDRRGRHRHRLRVSVCHALKCSFWKSIKILF
jgi:hypothetical protein